MCSRPVGSWGQAKSPNPRSISTVRCPYHRRVSISIFALPSLKKPLPTFSKSSNYPFIFSKTIHSSINSLASILRSLLLLLLLLLLPLSHLSQDFLTYKVQASSERRDILLYACSRCLPSKPADIPLFPQILSSYTKTELGPFIFPNQIKSSPPNVGFPLRCAKEIKA